jgi:hypothetical protein
MRETPVFPDDFSDYLLANGWERQAVQSSWISFHRNDCRLIVKGDTLDLMIWNDDAPGKPSWSLLFSFTGWSMLNTFTWMLLLHVINVVPIKQFLKRVKQEYSQCTAPVEQFLEHFQVDKLPTAY